MELDENKVQQIAGVFELLKDFCTHRFECTNCPFEKKTNRGVGFCKIKLSSGLPPYKLNEILTGPVVNNEE